MDHILNPGKVQACGSGNNEMNAAFEILVRIGLTENDT